ncbi:hypothetical protein BBF96_07695 [Anoxybacter fermentans]|uniref:DUF2344 domain-containing protein n=1 Tax=Anoxybacter fermentans TaxID=1323375 RepID=A0A3S9SY96_9FIRM|nr:TIGR03936 family radical SAM-associated protein [Anoxybacter fermentans]AZR73279.1 hypothetical protein BBF96_07695 [Anoxybacter fermentans]
MKRMRVQFSKSDEIRFISHLDLLRTISRAIRRAKVPIAFSQGFNPHHLISMGPALPVGLTSTGEYMDLEFQEEISVNEFFKKMKPQLPKGLELIKGEFISPQVDSLMAQINSAVYLVRLKMNSKKGIEQAVREFSNQKKILIKRKRKGKVRNVDIKPLIRELKVLEIDDQPFLQMRIQTGSKGNVRPEEVMAVLAQYEGIEEVPLTWMHRKGLYVETENKLLTPFEAARI